MKKRLVSNAMCGWAEAVALSAGEHVDFDRTSTSLASVEVFQQIREVKILSHCFYVPDQHVGLYCT